MRNAITLLHISDMQFGKFHRFAEGRDGFPNPHDTLTARLIADLKHLADPETTADELAGAAQVSHLALSELYLAIGDARKATHHALAAYKRAWADGEPYVHRYELTQTTALLRQMNVPIPNLPSYDPAKDEKLPWEADVRAAIEKLRAKKAAKKENPT